jgi:hypothetical protein
MLEILLSGGKTGRYFPDSGPGTKVLQAGDKNYGFFGTVTEDEMAVNSEFTRLLNETNAQVRSIGNIKNTWFKFIVNEKVLFFPQKPLAGKMLISDLYAMRGVFDTDEQYKPTTDPTTGTPLYTQTRHISNGTNLFKLRLMDTIPTDYKPATNAAWSYTTHQGEAWKLVSSLIKGSTAPPTDPLGIRTYDLDSFIRMHDGVQYASAFVKEFFPNASPASVGYFLHHASGSSTIPCSNVYEAAWRPVLELVPPVNQVDMVYLPENLTIQNQDLPNQTVTSGETVVDLTKLTNFTNFADAEQVVLEGSAPAAYRLAPMGGILVTEDGKTSAPIMSWSDDVGVSLYDLSAAGAALYSGNSQQVSLDEANALTYSFGASPGSNYGYFAAA